ncbi:unnamed protein product [Prorocentrum cordatum]|uniref:RNA-polymerase II-associated protein 3-like C-terminal domain-containing protein n=1 Tax=Prorocentrum cordatum TaxID=2364126 RepID=A0ABN9TH15_9DINO|nr:unnamed protein product [Polarella glacialis]
MTKDSFDGRGERGSDVVGSSFDLLASCTLPQRSPQPTHRDVASHSSGDGRAVSPAGSRLQSYAGPRGWEDAPADTGLDEDGLTQTLERLDLWPPELSPGDRSEVFTALRVPAVAAVRALRHGQPLPRRVSRRLFCEGFARVPFNLPDFPVPTHLLSTDPAIGVEQVAQAIATTFCNWRAGLELVKDFWMSGLLSLEEIQTALPFLVRHTQVEDAALRVIRVGATLFTPQEWHTMVRVPRESIGLLMPQTERQTAECEALPRQSLTPVDLSAREARLAALQASPTPAPPWHRQDLRQETPPQAAPGRLPAAAAAELPSSRGPGPSGGGARRALAAGCRVNIDWSTARPVDSNGHDSDVTLLCGHQADEGAGLRDGGGRPLPGPSSAAAAAPSAAAASSCQATPQLPEAAGDPARFISLDRDLPNDDCRGPFLAVAFVRCCQLYESRGL